MIIGLTGYAQVGKDTAALGLIKDGWKRMAFADNLKMCMATTLRISKGELEINKSKLRPLMVQIGKLGRELDPMRWIDPVMMDIVADDSINYVITDVRYPNEAEEIIANGGMVVGIVRPCYEPANAEEAVSVAEVFEKYASYVILNTGTEELAEKRLRVIAGILRD